MCGITTKDHPIFCPDVAAARGELEWAGAYDVDTVLWKLNVIFEAIKSSQQQMCEPKNYDLPISTALVSNIRKNHLLNHVTLGHLVAVLFRTHDKLEAPEMVFWEPKSSANSRSFRIAEEPKFLWEEKIVHLIRVEP